jgi:hypothetical protein
MSAFKLCLVILFALLLVALALLLVRSRPTPSAPPVVSDSGERISQELSIQVSRLEARERTIDKTVWAQEILAQECGSTFESLWDSLNIATNKLALVASFAADKFVLSKWNPPQKGPHGIEVQEPAGTGRELGPVEWRNLVEEFERAGWQLAQTEFRHIRFETDEAGQPRQSHFYFAAHLTNSDQVERAIIEGILVVEWGPQSPSGGPRSVKRIDASRLTVKTRRDKPPFECVLLEHIKPAENAYSIDPLIVHDLDGDGLSEIILAAKNLVYRRPDKNRFQPEPLCRYPPGLISTALIADFDGDGAADFLCQKHEGLVLLKGSSPGLFDQPERMVWPAPADLKYPMVLTCGDIDRDGDLDLFLGQYKVPYEGGALPTPYYDANDGYPAYLLLNDGRGNLADATEASGLSQKRRRRSYSSSFVDLDRDNHLDLVVVSDFAGVDVYGNNGQGHFTDTTRQWIAEPQAFGMAHALADFNADGQLDLLMMGMTSPTADRLEHFGVWRSGMPEDRTMRSRMTVGNRLYLARSDGGFEQTPLSDSIARSGWSWGCSAFDFNNDGFPDVYVANGLESRESVRDYESEYWLHDKYVGNSQAEPVPYLYFKSKFARTRGRGQSYGGHERNRFFLNRHGASFLEVGHLLGVGLEQDSRNVVSDDLDGDGRMDLLVASFEAWPEAKQTLRIYKNTLKDSGNWIGFRFREGPKSPVGVQITLRYGGHSAVRQIVNGDSYRSQHANTLHFGLGEAERIESAEIQWPNGQAVTLLEPALNRYHAISAPAGSSIQR